MSRKFVLPVANESTEGFELKVFLEEQLTDFDYQYLEAKAELQQEPGHEQELTDLLQQYLEAKQEEKQEADVQEDQEGVPEGEKEPADTKDEKKTKTTK